jgi:hypothetical protein
MSTATWQIIPEDVNFHQPQILQPTHTYIHTYIHTCTPTHTTKLSDNGIYIMHVTTYSHIKVRTVNKILLPAWHMMICCFCKYRCQNTVMITCTTCFMNGSVLLEYYWSAQHSNMGLLHVHVQFLYTPHELKHVTTTLLTRWYTENRKIMSFWVWLHIIWETSNDASNQPVASISRIFYPEDVNSTLLRRQVHIHQIKTATHLQCHNRRL